MSKKLRPLRDRVFVSKLEYKHPILAVVGITIEKGLVIATGPGRRMRRKTRFDGPQGKCLWFEDGDETGKIRPMKVFVGQCIEFSPRGGIDFEVDGVPLLCVWEQSIYGVSSDSASDALLWSKPGGYDRQGNFMSGADLYIP